MKINKVRLVNSNLSVAIDYTDESGQEHLLILGAENVVENWQAVEPTLAPDALRVCGKCGLSEQNHADSLCNPNYSAGKA